MKKNWKKIGIAVIVFALISTVGYSQFIQPKLERVGYTYNGKTMNWEKNDAVTSTEKSGSETLQTPYNPNDGYWILTYQPDGWYQTNSKTGVREKVADVGYKLKEGVKSYKEVKKEKLGDLSWNFGSDGSVYQQEVIQSPFEGKQFSQITVQRYKIPSLPTTSTYGQLGWSGDGKVVWFTERVYDEQVGGGFTTKVYKFNVETKELITIVDLNTIWSHKGLTYENSPEDIIFTPDEQIWLFGQDNTPLPGKEKNFGINGKTLQQFRLPDYATPNAVIQNEKFRPDQFQSKISLETRNLLPQAGVFHTYDEFFTEGMIYRITRGGNVDGGKSEHDFARTQGVDDLNADTYNNTIKRLDNQQGCAIECNQCNRGRETSPLPVNSNSSYCMSCGEKTITGCNFNRHTAGATDAVIISPNPDTRYITPDICTVLRIQNDQCGGAGKTLSLLTSFGDVFTFDHMSRIEPWVKVGMQIPKGVVLGAIGSTGDPNGDDQGCTTDYPFHAHIGQLAYNCFEKVGADSLNNGNTFFVFKGNGFQPSPKPFIPRQNVTYKSIAKISSDIGKFPTLDPSLAALINCNQTISGNTETARHYNLVKYGEGDLCSGPEDIYKFECRKGEKIVITFEDTKEVSGNNTNVSDLDVFICKGINTQTGIIGLLNSDESGIQIKELTPDYTGAMYLVIDGKNRRYGSYTLKVTQTPCLPQCTGTRDISTLAKAFTASDDERLLTLSDAGKKVGANIIAFNRKRSVTLKLCKPDNGLQYVKIPSIYGKGMLSARITAFSTEKVLRPVGSNALATQVDVCKSVTACGDIYLEVAGTPGTYELQLTWDGFKDACSGRITDEPILATRSIEELDITGKESVCGKETITLTSNGSPNTIWWRENEQGASERVHQGSTYTVTIDKNVTYSICDTISGCAKRGYHTITFTEVPNLTLLAPSNNSPNAPVIIPNTQIKLTAYGSFSHYEWKGENGRIVGSGSSVTVQPSVTTRYVCTGKTTSGCSVESNITVSTGSIATGGDGSTTGGSGKPKISLYSITPNSYTMKVGANIGGNFGVIWDNQSVGTNGLVKVYLSSNPGKPLGSIPSNQILWISNVTGFTNPAKFATVNWSGSVPNITPGTYYLTVELISSPVYDADPSDNYQSVVVEVRGSDGSIGNNGGPTLFNAKAWSVEVFEAGTRLGQVQPGSLVNMKVTIQNSSSVSPTSSIPFAVYFSTDNSFNINSPNNRRVYEGSINQSGFTPNTYWSSNLFSVIIPYIDGSSNLKTYLVVDPYNQVNENNESDNIAQGGIGLSSGDFCRNDFSFRDSLTIQQGSKKVKYEFSNLHKTSIGYELRDTVIVNTFSPDPFILLFNYWNTGGCYLGDSEQRKYWKWKAVVSRDKEFSPDDLWIKQYEFNLETYRVFQDGLIRSWRTQRIDTGYILIQLNSEFMPERDRSNNMLIVPVILRPDSSAKKFDVAISIDSVFNPTIGPNDTLKYLVIAKNNGPDEITTSEAITARAQSWLSLDRSLPFSELNWTDLTAQVIGVQQLDTVVKKLQRGQSTQFLIKSRILTAPQNGLMWLGFDRDFLYKETSDGNKLNDHDYTPVYFKADTCYATLRSCCVSPEVASCDTIQSHRSVNLAGFTINQIGNCSFEFQNCYFQNTGYGTFLLQGYQNTTYQNREVSVSYGGKKLYSVTQLGRECEEVVREDANWAGVSLYPIYTTGNVQTIFSYRKHYPAAWDSGLPIYWYRDTLGSSPIAIGDTLRVVSDTTFTVWTRFYSSQCDIYGKWSKVTLYSYLPNNIHWTGVESWGNCNSAMPNRDSILKLGYWLNRNLGEKYPITDVTISILGDTIKVGAGIWMANVLVRLEKILLRKSDAIPPTLTGVPKDTTLWHPDSIPNVQITAQSNCYDSIPVTLTTVRDTQRSVITITRTWKACDPKGHCIQKIQVIRYLLPDWNYQGRRTALKSECNILQDTSGLYKSIFWVNLNRIQDTLRANKVERTNTGLLYSVQNLSWLIMIEVIKDTIPPQLTGVPQDTTIWYPNSVPNSTVRGIDNCDSTVTVIYTEKRDMFSRIIIDTMHSKVIWVVITREWKVQDAQGNKTTERQTIQYRYPPIKLNQIFSHPRCYGELGRITLRPSGGISPYTYIWSDGSRAIIRNLTNGVSTAVIVTDQIGQTVVYAVQPIEPKKLEVQKIQEKNKFHQTTLGVLPSGGTPPYQYYWTEDGKEIQKNTQTLTNVRGERYSVTITDANGCWTTETFSVSQLPVVQKTKEILVFPNPTTGHIRILSELGALSITNPFGQVIIERRETEGEVEFNLPNSGVYLVRFKSSLTGEIRVVTVVKY